MSNKKTLNYYDQSAFLTQLKKQDDTSWLKETNSQALQYSLKCLDQAYQNFFNKRTQFPRFKKKNSRNSFTINQHLKIEDKKIHFPKFKDGIKMIMERKVEGKIKKITVSRTSSGKYYVSILSEKEHKPIEKTSKKVGIDLGIKDFIVLSNGLKIKNHRFLKHYERQLKFNQKHLSRKTKGSKRYEKQRIKVAKIHEKITNSRMDLIHKSTTKLINHFDIIYLEDLDVKGMMKNHNLAKAISDSSWSKFIDVLTYKAQWNDKEVVHIDRFFPSSKTCSNCGWHNHSLSLKDRKWKCSGCGETLDRDVNAAINIFNEGCRKNMSDKKLSAGTADYKRGAKISLSKANALESTSYETLKEKPLI